MPYRLREERVRKHGKTGEPYNEVSFHSGFLANLFPTATFREDEAKVFSSREEAARYNRLKLRGRGYKVEKIATA